MENREEKQTYEHISEEKFSFVQMDEKLHDKELDTKPIGFFRMQ